MKRSLETEIRTYEPDNAIKKGYLGMIPEIARELKQNRWLIRQFFKRDFAGIYKQSIFGLLWPLLIPILSVGTFIIMNRSGVLSIGPMDVPYPIFAVLGLALWQLFARGIVAGANSLVKAGAMIAKINFSRKSLVVASLGQALVSFLIQLLLCLVLFIYYGITPKAMTFFLPLLVLPLLFLTLGLGLILSIINGIARDIGNSLTIVMTFLMFLTPVLYARPESGILALITRYNPLYYLVAVPRDLILLGSSQDWVAYFVVSGISIFVFLFCLLIFHLTETRVAERI